MTFLCEIPAQHLAYLLTLAGGTSEHSLGVLDALPQPVEPDGVTLGTLAKNYLILRPSLAMEDWGQAFRDLLRTLNNPRRVIDLHCQGAEHANVFSWYLPFRDDEEPDSDASDIVGLVLRFDGSVQLMSGLSRSGVASMALEMAFPGHAGETIEVPAPPFEAELTPEHGMALALVLDALVSGDQPVARIRDVVETTEAIRNATAFGVGGYAFCGQLVGCAANLPSKRQLRHVFKEYEGQGWLVKCGRGTWAAAEDWDPASFRMVGVTRVASLDAGRAGDQGERIIAFHGARHGFGLRMERCADKLLCAAVTPEVAYREIQSLAL